MEFLSRSTGGEGPLVAFGSSDGVIRVLSMITWKVRRVLLLFVLHQLFILLYSLWIFCISQLVRRYTGGHKGSISCLMTFMASSGEVTHFFG